MLGSLETGSPAGRLINIFRWLNVQSGPDKVRTTEIGFCITELLDTVFLILHKTNSAVLGNAVRHRGQHPQGSRTVLPST